MPARWLAISVLQPEPEPETTEPERGYHAEFDVEPRGAPSGPTWAPAWIVRAHRALLDEFALLCDAVATAGSGQPVCDGWAG